MIFGGLCASNDRNRWRRGYDYVESKHLHESMHLRVVCAHDWSGISRPDTRVLSRKTFETGERGPVETFGLTISLRVM